MAITEQATTDQGAATRIGAGQRSGRLPMQRLWQAATIAAAILLWWLVALTGVVSSDALPTPPAIASALFRAIQTSAFWVAVGQTLQGALIGLLAAAVIGIPLGLVTGTYAPVERATRLLVDMLRSFPVIALLPVFLLVLGSSLTMKATVVFLACVFPVLLQAQYGARGIDPAIQETAHSYRIPRLLRFRKVILPGATPSIMTGLRLAATTSVLVALGVEILTTLPGMGQQLTHSQQDNNAPVAFAYVIAAGLLGYTVNKGSEAIEHRLLRWRQPSVSS